jgi:hypothetical protein
MFVGHGVFPIRGLGQKSAAKLKLRATFKVLVVTTQAPSTRRWPEMALRMPPQAAAGPLTSENIAPILKVDG